MVVLGACYDVPHSYPIKGASMDTTQSKKPANKSRLSRSSIREGLEQIPVGVLISGTGKKSKLTPKQKKFAHALATGEYTQADAYRKAYNARGKPKTIGDNASRLAKHSGIQAETEAIQAALEAMKYQNAGQIKALVVHQLTQHALNEDNPPAQRIKALELLGRTHDVGLFVERKEVHTITSSGDIKARLFDQLKTFIRADVEDVEDVSADSLLAELAGEKTPTGETSAADDPTAPAPPEVDGFAVSPATHSIPLTRTTPKSVSFDSEIYNHDSQVVDLEGEKVVTSNVLSEKEGVGGIEIPSLDEDISMEKAPLMDSGSPGNGDMPSEEDYLAALGPCGK